MEKRIITEKKIAADKAAAENKERLGIRLMPIKQDIRNIYPWAML